MYETTIQTLADIVNFGQIKLHNPKILIRENLFLRNKKKENLRN